jgi:hypothetical protein
VRIRWPWPFSPAKPIDLDRNVEVGTAAALATMDVALAAMRDALVAVEEGVVFDDHEADG